MLLKNVWLNYLSSFQYHWVKDACLCWHLTWLQVDDALHCLLNMITHYRIFPTAEDAPQKQGLLSHKPFLKLLVHISFGFAQKTNSLRNVRSIKEIRELENVEWKGHSSWQ